MTRGRPSLDGTAGVSRTISLRLPDGLHDALRVEARRCGISVSQLLRAYVESGLGIGREEPYCEETPFGWYQ